MAVERLGQSERRKFFREVLLRAVKPVGDFLERRIGRFGGPAHLRPPGAVAEDRFSDTCRRCGACVEACPAEAIFSLGDSHGHAAGTPVIDPDGAACVVCDGLKCTHVCPSGALLPLYDAHLIHMGLAEVYEPLCVRTRGEECELCVARCPLGAEAIRFDDEGPPVVVEAGCVGCGVCQLACPTTPKAIVVKPDARRA